MKKNKSIIWGVLLITVGVLVALKVLDIVNVNIFFDGWWTLFIIVPSFIGLITEKDKIGNIICLLIGVALLLACRDIISFELILKLALPVIIIIIGVKIILSGVFGGKAEKIAAQKASDGKELKNTFAAFSASEVDYSGEVFEGAELNAIFGGVKCDLRNAVIENDCVIKVSAIFGGIDVLVPPNVKIKLESTSIFGGMSNKTQNASDGPTLYISGACMFGGVDVK